jgi:hypothetical protein
VFLTSLTFIFHPSLGHLRLPPNPVHLQLRLYRSSAAPATLNSILSPYIVTSYCMDTNVQDIFYGDRTLLGLDDRAWYHQDYCLCGPANYKDGTPSSMWGSTIMCGKSTPPSAEATSSPSSCLSTDGPGFERPGDTVSTAVGIAANER